MPIIQYTKEVIELNIVKVAQSEKITKAVLSVLSRELLAYVYETNDVAMVTRLIDVLTPVNKKVALLYFPAFLGWCFDEKTGTFGKKAKDKMYSKKYDATVEWLAMEANDIWLWADNEIVLQAKPKNYAAKLTQLITKAMKDEDQGLDAKEILFAILASDELSLGDLMAPLAEIQDNPAQEVA